MKRRAVALAVAVLAAAGLVAAWRLGLFERGAAPAASGKDGPRRTSDAEPVDVDVFFPSESGLLYPERRRISGDGDAEARLGAIVAELFAGPHADSLRAPMPPGASLRRVYLLEDGTAVVDLASAEATPPPSGSQQEVLTVFALVNSLTLNVEEAERVVLLWNGEQPVTFAGHIDTTRPLVADRELVAGGER